MSKIYRRVVDEPGIRHPYVEWTEFETDDQFVEYVSGGAHSETRLLRVRMNLPPDEVRINASNGLMSVPELPVTVRLLQAAYKFYYDSSLYIPSRWGDWLILHPECMKHEPFHGCHDALQDPEGCGHCVDCHTGRDHGHSAGCPGC